MPRRPAFHVRVEEELLIGSASLGDDTWDGDERREQPSLGVKLTGYRLLIVGVILVFGVTKAALACCGRSSALSTIDWVVGASSGLILYWVGQFDTRNERRPRWTLFFHVDWALEILESMKCVEIPSVGYVLYSNKLNCLNSYAQDSRLVAPRPGTFLLQVSNWLLDAAVDLLRRHLHWNYVSSLTMAFLFITLPLVESSFSLLVP